jgi:hypothetical protein
MNLYILNDDYTPGMCVIAAESLEQCNEFFMKEFGRSDDSHLAKIRNEEHQKEFDTAEIKVIENVNHPAGVVSYVYGGGMTNHPITPPTELVEQWREKWSAVCGPFGVYIATKAAQWGADQELEACCEYLVRCAQWEPEDVAELRAARRPKPPSLKEQALGLLNEGPVNDLRDYEVDIIRRALEALPE